MLVSIKLPWLQKTLQLILLLSAIFYYGNGYLTILPRPISDIEKNETQQLFQYIRTETNSNDVISFFKPRVLALFTQRKSIAITVSPPNGDTLARMKELDVTIVVLRKNYNFDNQPELSQFLSTHPGNFKLLFDNPEFQVLKTIY